MRQFEIRDAGAVFTTVDRNRAYLRQWLPWVDYTQSPEDIRQFIARVQAQYDANQGPQAGIWVKGELAGALGCHAIDWANRNSSIGYWVDQQHQGKGLITRCCTEMLEYLFREIRLHRVEIRCGTGNHRSCAIPQRLGFTREGIAREAEWVNDRWVDLVVWSMLQDDWRKRA
ncbi:MAG TPA: GNAT family protein [Bryobacteraceae bacterium]|nr:GNAT family protein [Bryobacteraceae bacterium]